MQKIKKGDRVIVLQWPRQGQEGRGVPGHAQGRAGSGARRKPGARHQRQTAQQEGGIISKEAPIHLSNLALEDPKDGKPTRVGFTVLADGRKVRVAKRSGEHIPEAKK